MRRQRGRESKARQVKGFITKENKKQLRKDVQAIVIEVKTFEARGTGNVARNSKEHDLQHSALENRQEFGSRN